MKNSCNSLPKLPTQAYKEGAVLLPCVLLLLVVLMLETASLVSSRNLRSMAQAHAGREFARRAAEAALTDAQRHLMIADDPLSSADNGVSHEFGSVTGQRYPAVPGMTSASPPVYRIERLSVTGSTGISRITATGWGATQSQQLSLQADYAVTVCDLQAPRVSEEKTEETPDRPACARTVRLLSWRELDDE